MSRFLPGARHPIDGWRGVVDWLVASFAALDLGDVLEVGPSGAHEHDDDVPNIAVQKLHDEAIWMQVSTGVITIPVLASYEIGAVELDTWLHDPGVSDASDGFIVSTDHRLLAEAVVIWFADRACIDLLDLGCELTRAVRLG